MNETALAPVLEELRELLRELGSPSTVPGREAPVMSGISLVTTMAALPLQIKGNTTPSRAPMGIRGKLGWQRKP